MYRQGTIRSYHRIYDGTNLFLEVYSDGLGDSRLLDEYERQRHFIEIRFNLAGEKRSNRLKIDKRSPLRELREQIEGAVRAARPQWAEADVIGQEIGAFADFLIWGLQATPRLRGRAVAVYNQQDGTCEIFRSPHHANRRSPIIALWYAGPGPGRLGHYNWLRLPSHATFGQVLTIHRRSGGRGHRVPTLVTDAVG